MCAASPSSTTLTNDQWSHSTRRKLIHAAEPPRRWAALLIRGWPSRLPAKIASQARRASSWSMASKPRPRQVASEHSTMKVERVSSKR